MQWHLCGDLDNNRCKRELNEPVQCKLIAPCLSISNLGEMSIRQPQRYMDAIHRNGKDRYDDIVAYVQKEERNRHEDEVVYRRINSLQMPTGETLLNTQKVIDLGMDPPQEHVSAKVVKKTTAKDAKVITRDGV